MVGQIVIASSFAFIEIGRKFDIISDGKYTIEKFRAFIESPPEWFQIASVDESLFIYYSQLHSLRYN